MSDAGTPDPRDPTDSTDSTGASIAVLIVDDHAMVAHAFASILLTAPDITIAGLAGDSEAALRVADRHHVDVVLMDYNLPTADGVTCAAILRERHPRIRIIILTGSVSDVDTIIARTINEGCDGFLSKADGADELIDAVRRAHAGEAVFSASAVSSVTRLLQRKAPYSTLSTRELEVLELMATGVPTAELAERLYISVHTVRSHIRHILEKLNAHSKLEAVAIAVRDGLIKMPTSD